MRKLFVILRPSYRLVSLLLVFLMLFSSGEALAQTYNAAQLNAIKTNTPRHLPGACKVDSGPATPLSGDDNIAKIYNYLIGKGLKDFQAAGIMGNMHHESGFEPKRAQGIFDRLVEPKDWAQAKGGGYGLVQWTLGSKMVDPVTAAGKDAGELSVQLDFLWGQLNNKWPEGWPGQAPSTGFNEKAAGDAVKASEDITEATVAFELQYERHAGGPQPDRVVEAQKILDRLKGSGGGGSIYILGDSITARSATKYKEAFPDAVISARVGRSWSGGGQEDNANTGTQGPANTAVDTDKEAIKAAKTIIIALGTNGYADSNPIDEILTKITGINGTAKIYWVNVANASEKTPGFNTALVERQTAGKITVINWAGVVDPGGDGSKNPKKILDDGTHPRIDKVPDMDKSGVELLVELVSGVVSTGGAGTPSTGDDQCVCKVDGATSGVTNSSSVVDFEYTDAARGNRAIGVSVWKPEGSGTYPLVMFAPGRNQNSKADGYYKRYLKAIANSGFVVAGLNFSDNTEPGAVPNDADDVKFAIDKILAEEQLKSMIDASDIGMVGHSDGGFVAGLVGYADNKKDSRIKAVILENGAGYAGYTYASGPALLGMLGTNDSGNAGAVSGAYGSIKTPYSGLAKFEGADHDQYIVSETSEYKQAVDAITTAFLSRTLKGQVTDQTDPAKVAEGYKDKVTFESKKGEGQETTSTNSNTSANSADCPGTVNTQGLSATILAYAWPQYEAGKLEQMPVYAQVVKEKSAKGEYVGGIKYPGNDCGGFVTRALIDSGFLPEYNYGGKWKDGASNAAIAQLPWAKANMQSLGTVTSSSQLQPGDVAFDYDAGHTWMFVGKIEGFGSEIASASMDQRAPMAGTEGLTYNGATWYRKK